jgi:hypothetical protein
MKLVLTMNLDNAAFEEPAGYEVARILGELRDKISGESLIDGDGWVLRDVNGNRVGEAKVTD